MALFPLFYAGNITFYQALIAADEVVFDVYEHFRKQTFRNRIEIVGPNGLQKLIIPTVKTGQRRPMHSVKISYAEDWQKDHWKGLEAAYRRSPYFEFYEDQFRLFYQQEIPSLLAFNLNMHETICQLLDLSIPHNLSALYQDSTDIDYRMADFSLKSKITGVKEIQPYLQVFSDRQPFMGNLSILDAIFNLGPQAKELLKNS